MSVFFYLNTSKCGSSESLTSKVQARKARIWKTWKVIHLTKKLLKIYIFSLLLSLSYLLLVSQCIRYSISFTPFLNLRKTKNLDFFSLSWIFTISNFFTGPMEVRDSGCRLYVKAFSRELVVHHQQNTFRKNVSGVQYLNVLQKRVQT